MTTWAEVETKLEQRRVLYGAMHQNMIEDINMFNWSADDYGRAAGERLKGLPAGFKPSFPPLAYNGVMVGVNTIISGKAPQVKVRPPDDAREDELTEGQQERRKRLRFLCKQQQKWCQGFLDTVAVYSTENPFRDLVANQRICGAGALRYPIAWNRLPEPPFGKLENGKPRKGRTAEERAAYAKWERERRDAFPWAVSSVSPVNLYFSPDADPPDDFITEEEVSLGALLGEYPALREMYGDETKKVKRVEYVSATEYGCWVDGNGVHGSEDCVENTVGRPWVRMAWDGSGHKDHNNDWARRGRGVLRDGRDVVIMMLVALNVMDALRQQYGFPPLEMTGDDPAALQELRERISLGAAQIWDHPSSIQVGVVKLPEIPQAVFQEFEQAEKLYAMQFGVPALRGDYKSEPAEKFRARSTAARLPFEAPQANAEQLAAAMLDDVLRMVKYELGEPVTLRGVTLRPEDVVEDAVIEVDFTPMTDEEKAFKRGELREDLAAGAITLAEYIRESREIDDPERVIQERAVEKVTEAILSDPQVIAVGVQGALRVLGVPAQPQGAPAQGQEMGNPVVEAETPVPEPGLGSPGEAAAGVSQVMGAPTTAWAPRV